jgi:hypothetical protein
MKFVNFLIKKRHKKIIKLNYQSNTILNDEIGEKSIKNKRKEN